MKLMLLGTCIPNELVNLVQIGQKPIAGKFIECDTGMVARQ